MLLIVFAVVCVAAVSAESSSAGSYSPGPSSSRDYEYSGGSYSSGKPSYSELGGGGNSYITSAAAAAAAAASSPYSSKSDSRFASDSSSDSGETRASLSNSYYKTKFGSDAVVNSLRPTPGAASAASSSSGSSDQSTGQYEYSLGPSATYYESNNPASQSSGSSPSEYPGSYTSVSYAERGPPEHHRQPIEYAHAKPVYSNGYSGLGEYAQVRPSGYSHSGISNPVGSPVSSGEYSGGSHHHHQHHHHREYPHTYKTYVTSSAASGPSTKYQTVFGALKSLFAGAGGALMPDTAPSAAHVPTYYSTHPMHAPTHHATSYSQSAPAGPSYYFSPGKPSMSRPGASSSGSHYSSKSYPSVRFMTTGGSGNNKIIVIRDSGSTHSNSYPGSGGTLVASASYPTKSKISGFAPSIGAGHAYVSGSPSSLQGYSSASSSSGYPGGYSSQGQGHFSGGHGGSTFLGYTV